MALIYCSKCGNQAMDTDNICSSCGNQLKQNIVPPEPANTVVQFKEATIKTDEITENIEIIKKAAAIVKILFIILAIISFIMAFIALGNVEWDDDYFGLVVLYGAIGGILLVFSRFIEAFIKWKAYMLKTNYEILKNTEKNQNNINKI